MKETVQNEKQIQNITPNLDTQKNSLSPTNHIKTKTETLHCEISSNNNSNNAKFDKAENILFQNVQIFTKYKCLTQDALNINEEGNNNGNYAIFIGDDTKESYSFKIIARHIAKLSLPTIFFYILMHVQQTICLSFLGKASKNQEIINGYGVTMLYISCTLSCVTAGVVSGLDTLLPNSHASGNFKLFNIYAQRARIITIMIGIILSVVHLFTAIPVLRFFGASEESLIYAKQVLPLALLAAILESQFSINFIILAVINKVYNTLILLSVSIIIHVVNNHIMINKFQLNTVGAGVSMVISQILNLSFTTILIYLENRSITNVNKLTLFFSLNKDITSGIMTYIEFVLPNTLLLTAEWMAFEIQGLFALAMSDNDYSVHLIIANLAHLSNTFSCGFAMATAILVAEKVGKLMMKESKFVAVYSFIIAQSFMSIIVILIILFRNSVFHLFTENDKLLDLGRDSVILLSLFSVFDATQSVMAGVFRGYGKQKIASIIALVQFYLVQTFLSWLFGFYFKKGVFGIWLSIVIGGFLTTVIYFIVFLGLDFDKIKIETKKRIETDSKMVEGAYSNLELTELK